jgi:hypothetical protein
MPGLVITMVHIAFAFHFDDPVRFFFGGKHSANIRMTTHTIGIAMTGRVIGKGRIDKIVLIIIHIHLIDSRHVIDNVERILKRSLVVFKHGMVESTFNKVTDIVPCLVNDCTHVGFGH